MKADLKKHTLHLRDGDWDFLESAFKPNGIPTSVAVRTIISNYVDKKRKEEQELIRANPTDFQVDL
jgi:hypothetical protein